MSCQLLSIGVTRNNVSCTYRACDLRSAPEKPAPEFDRLPERPDLLPQLLGQASAQLSRPDRGFQGVVMMLLFLSGVVLIWTS